VITFVALDNKPPWTLLAELSADMMKCRNQETLMKMEKIT
jgi:hypothetical protein